MALEPATGALRLYKRAAEGQGKFWADNAQYTILH